LRNLVPAFLVLPLAGQEAAGHLGLARRLVELFSFAREAASRLALPALATLREDKAKMIRAINEGMRLHTLGVSVFYVPAALFLPFLIKHMFRAEWDSRTVGLLFAFIASNYLVHGIFMLHSSALYAYRHNWTVALANAGYFLLLLGSAALLLPRYGALGYGLALVATLPSYWIFHWACVRLIGRPDYRVALLWLGGFSAAIFAPTFSLWLYLVAGMLLLHPASLREFVKLYKNIRALQSQTVRS
jgi:O-antigen/teichoic acid export membrane protein